MHVTKKKSLSFILIMYAKTHTETVLKYEMYDNEVKEMT